MPVVEIAFGVNRMVDMYRALETQDVRDLLEFWREGAAVLDNVC